ncbi:nucleotidyltransferase family protein [Anaeromyxobacter paludicola]|uniref:Nucleotidyltransferase family protein n=1 Tax=Anaeromyxobacter paludicola TaxID=2918171 RepID=A0ABN6N8Q4_9BACT|nr:nucleotidyltransferase family protein [Anaeromyxobacter paludicola]BDG09605.1 hypothetical protein AMPC_27180 [Anaeromyxobacter paludicola]
MVPTDRAGEELATNGRSREELDARALALRALRDAGVPFVVAGAYAFFEYTGQFRDTKDLDVFLDRGALEQAFEVLERAGFRTELTDPGWIGKAWAGDYFVDLIFSSGNGVAEVDDLWFTHAREGVVMGVPVLLAPPEEIIWSKAFVCERERFDGADVANLLRAVGDELDWRRLLARFDRHWQVLFAHVTSFMYAYPSDRSKVPGWVVTELCRRTLDEHRAGDWDRPVCRGNLLSRVQYQHALEQLGYEDGRRFEERLRRAEGEGRHGETAELPAGGGR